MSRQPTFKNVWYRSPPKVVLLSFLAMAVILLIARHWVDSLGMLPFVMLLLCPLVYLFGHYSYGAHEQRGNPRDGDARGI